MNLLRLVRWGLVACVMAAAAAATAAKSPPPYFQPIWEKSVNFIHPNDPVVADLNADGTNDIVITDSRGSIVAFSGSDGRRLWSTTLDGGTPTAAVVGHFWGDGSIDVVLADNNRYLYLFNGANGRFLQQMDVGTSITIDPTVLPPDPVSAADGTWDFRPQELDRVLIISGDNRLKSLVFNPDPDKAGIEWEVDLRGRARSPAAVGDVNGDGRFEIAVGVEQINQGLLHVVRGIDGSPLPASPANYASGIRTVVTLADVNSDGRDELFFATSSRHLHAIRYEPDQQRFWPLWEQQGIVQEPRSDPLLATVEGLGAWLIVIQTNSLILVAPVDGSASTYEGSQSPMTTGLGLASGEPGARPRVIFGDELGAVYDWYVDGQPTEKTDVQYPREKLELTPVLADFDGAGGAECLFYFSRKKRLQVAACTDQPYPCRPNDIVWQTRAGNVWRTGWRDVRRYYPSLAAHYQYAASKVAATLQATREAVSAKKWKRAMQEANAVLEFNPFHKEALKLRRKAWVRDHIVLLGLAVIAGLTGLGFLGYFGERALTRSRVTKQAVLYIEEGRMDEAIDLYMRLHRRFPNHSPTSAALAGVLIGQDRLEPQYATVFETAHNDRPGDGRLLQALSECFARSGALTPHARDVYMKSLDVSARPAEIKFLIGRSFLAEDNPKDAVRYLGEALAEGFRQEEVYQSLADACFALKIDQEEVISVLEHVAPARQEDVRFMSYLCDVYLANERSDEKARDCAEKTLEYDPSCRSARMLYVRILLDHEQVEGAWRRTETLLSENPEHPEALHLAGLCMVALDRRDDEAVELLEKALEHHPEDARILAHLSHVYFMRGWFDPHAAEIHRRAHEINPDDDRVVEAMANLAQREDDNEAEARYLEKLLRLGRENRELFVRLARVYRNLGIDDERARRPYEIALEENPESAECLAALGKTYIRLGETGPEALAVLGGLHEQGADVPGLTRHLIEVLYENTEYDYLLTLCENYLKNNPDDSEVKRIRARTLLATDQVERATEEFERLLDEGPESDQVITELGLAYAHAGRTDERAISTYRRALRVSPEQDDLNRALGRAHAERGDLAEAVNQFRAALRTRKDSAEGVIADCAEMIEADPNRTTLRWFLCEVLINCGRFREATEHLRILYDRQPEGRDRTLEALGHILEVDPENSRAFRVRGELLLRLGKIAEARADLEASDELRPNQEDTETLLKAVYEGVLEEGEDAEVRFRLGRILRHSGDLDTALRCFQKSVHDYRFENDSTREMGRIFMEKSLLDLALEEFQKLDVDDDLKETIYQLGQLYEQRGDGGGARAAYRIIFAADAGFRDVQERFEALSGEGGGEKTTLDRTMIISQLSEKAKHRYKLLEEIGRGAMGIVYRAMDSELDEIVALKILPDNLSTNDDALTRFRREARSARRLSHRNIVRIHDIGEEMGRKYISMEFVEGTTLKALIRASGGLEIPRALKYTSQILDALAYAHSIGIVHRDIKPANIMITHEDEVKITDFGIAKILESTDATAEGAVVGTPLYMSPEQVRGEPVDHRADIYSIGILLYETIEGRPPFVKGDLAYSHLHVFPDPMTRGFSELNAVVMRALEKRKEERWNSTQEMLDAINALEMPESSTPPPPAASNEADKQ